MSVSETFDTSSDHGIDHAVDWLSGRLEYLNKQPWQVTIETAKTDAELRTLAQNRLQFKWYSEAAEQLKEYDADGYRAYCKLNFGVKMLVTENEDFRQAWHDKILGKYDYEQKIQFMSEPFNMPVTSIMTTKQKARYLDQVHEHFSRLGAQLTQP